MHGHQYTQAEKDFFIAYVPGHTYAETQSEFIARFAWNISVGQVKGYMANHKINNGLSGQFKKGHIPRNKGKKGVCAVGCEKGWFKKGHIPTNHRPVGSERITKDGYVEVKTMEPNRWRLKHRLLWEERHGQIPRGKCLIFLNGDRADARIENLTLIERKTQTRLNQSGLWSEDPDLMRSAVGLGELMSAIGEAKRGKKRMTMAGEGRRLS